MSLTGLSTTTPQPRSTFLDRAQKPLVFLLLLMLSGLLIIQCWRAPFLTYDDPLHITGHPLVQADHVTIAQMITPQRGETYFPVTLTSYRIDRALFESWMPAQWDSWAPGVRFMNMLYHALGAWLLWRLLVALRLSAGSALFVACVYAGHPMACESVAWLSERKNVLSSLFSLIAMLLWVRGEEKIWRIPATLVTWWLALSSNPNSLGMLPIFAVYDLMGGVRGLHGEAPMHWKAPREWVRVVERLALFAIAAIVIIRINMAGFAATIMPPPGGSLFTALLTDLEIVARYISNTLAPAWISASYCIVPVKSLTDARVWTYGMALVAGFAATIYFAENRRFAFFAWIWIIGALGTHLNLQSIAFLMQDRYFYLSAPGVLILVALVARGLCARVNQPSRHLSVLGATAVIVFALMAASRSYTWNNMYVLFTDAAYKEPYSGFAQYGCAQAYERLMEIESMRPKPDAKVLQGYRNYRFAHLFNAVKCPDAKRIPAYLQILITLGEEACKEGNFKLGEEYFLRATDTDPEMQQSAELRATGMRNVGVLKFREGKYDEAQSWFDRSEALQAHANNYIYRAHIFLIQAARQKSAGQNPASALQHAREELAKVPKSPEWAEAAQAAFDELKRQEAQSAP